MKMQSQKTSGISILEKSKDGETEKTFKISPNIMTAGLITTSIVYLTMSNTGHFTAIVADTGMKITGMIGSSVVKIICGDIASTMTLLASSRLSEYVKSNISMGSEVTSICTSAIAGVVVMIIGILLQIGYNKTISFFSKDKKIEEFKEEDFMIKSIDDFEMIELIDTLSISSVEQTNKVLIHPS
jgi:hypothetical protein